MGMLKIHIIRKRGKILWTKHSPINFSWEYFCGALARGVDYLTIAKYSWENFCSNLKNHENRKSLAQRIFPNFWYIGSLI